MKRAVQPSLPRRILSGIGTFLIWFAVTTVVWIVGILGFSFYQKSLYQAPTMGASSTAHFTVINEGIAKNDAEDVGSALEQNYARVLSDLGVSTMPHVIVHIYPKDSQEFIDASGQAKSTDNLQGFVLGNSLDTMYLRWATDPAPGQSLLEQIHVEEFVRQNAVHEFTHLVEHNMLYEKALASGWARSRAEWSRACATVVLGIYCTVPNWFDESTAQYEAHAGATKTLLEEYESKADMLEPTAFDSIDRYTYGRFVGEYIDKTFGKEGLRKMVYYNADVQAALGLSIESFNAGFRAYTAERMKGMLLQYKTTGHLWF